MLQLRSQICIACFSEPSKGWEISGKTRRWKPNGVHRSSHTNHSGSWGYLSVGLFRVAPIFWLISINKNKDITSNRIELVYIWWVHSGEGLFKLQSCWGQFYHQKCGPTRGGFLEMWVPYPKSSKSLDHLSIERMLDSFQVQFLLIQGPSQDAIHWVFSEMSARFLAG